MFRGDFRETYSARPARSRPHLKTPTPDPGFTSVPIPLPPSPPSDSDQQGFAKRLVLGIIVVLAFAVLGGRFYVERQVGVLQDELAGVQSQHQAALNENDSTTNQDLTALADAIADARAKLDEDIPAELDEQYEDLVARLTTLASSSDAATSASAAELLALLINSAGSGIATSGSYGTTISNTGVLSVNNGTGAVTITGTASQITVGGSGSNVLLGLPQDIADSSTPTFAGLSITGALTAGSLAGDGASLTNVDAVTLQGNTASYYTDAGNLSSGTIADARLSTNVALKDQTNTFTVGQAIQTGSAGTIGLTVTGAAGQSTSLQRWVSNGGTVLASISAGGNFSAQDITGANLNTSGIATADIVTINGTSGLRDNRFNGILLQSSSGTASNRTLQYGNATYWSQWFNLTNSGAVGIGADTGGVAALGRLYVSLASATQPGIVVRGAAGQSGDLQRWQDSSANSLTRIASTGDLYVGYGAGSRNLEIWSATTSTLQLKNGLNYWSLANNGSGLQLSSSVSNGGAFTIRGSATQSSNLQSWVDNGGTTLASIGSTGNLVARSATFTGTLTVNGHIVSGNTTGSTTVAANAAAGAGSSASISGNDTAGTVTITTGTGATSGSLATITFATSFGAAPRVVLSASDADAAALQIFRTATTTTFVINAAAAPTDSTAYEIDYFVIQ